MTDKMQKPGTERVKANDTDELQPDDGPLKQHGDALADGSGSRQGENPPSTERQKRR